MRAERSEKNPLLTPEFFWEEKGVFNPGAIEIEEKIYLVYRAQGEDNISRFGLAIFDKDGETLLERDYRPIFPPKEIERFFQKQRILLAKENKKDVFIGCEDPRITIVGERLIICFTFVTGDLPPRIGITSIALRDFLRGKWDKFSPVRIVSPPTFPDNDACLIKKQGRYFFFHRPGLREKGLSIWLDEWKRLKGRWVKGREFISPKLKWQEEKIGLGPPPLEIGEREVVIFHGVDENKVYRVGISFFREDFSLIKEWPEPILEPEAFYEKEGEVSNVVFPCGAIQQEDRILIYYGGADRVVGLAILKIEEIFEVLRG